MIRTKVVNLTKIKGIAFRQKLPSGGSGIVILREGVAQPGIASISKTSGEAIPTANTPTDVYPPDVFKEAISLTAGLPYKKLGKVQLNDEIAVEAPAEKQEGNVLIALHHYMILTVACRATVFLIRLAILTSQEEMRQLHSSRK